MPKLSSGRHVSVAPLSLLEQIKFGEEFKVYQLIFVYRMAVQEPKDLRNVLPVIYFLEGQGEPPDAPQYESGHLVQDVLDGKAGWSEIEIEDFKKWLETDPALNDWVNTNFKEIDEAIRNSPL